MVTNLPSCFSIQCLEQRLKFVVNFTLLKYVKCQRSYGFLITKELIFGFQILDLKDHFSASLKDTLMVHACKRYKLHTFSSFREIKTNSLLPKIIDQQLRHLRHQWGLREAGKRQFPTSVRIPCRNFRP